MSEPAELVDGAGRRVRVRFRSPETLAVVFARDLRRGRLDVACDRVLEEGVIVELLLEMPDGGSPAVAIARVTETISAELAAATGRKAGMRLSLVNADGETLRERIEACLPQALTERPAAQDFGPRGQVLVVDDSHAYREHVAEALRFGGHHVEVATHGLDGFSLALERHFDCIVSDIQMPIMNGWQMLRMLKAHDATHRIPVAFLTTLSSERDRLEGYRRGVDDYIEKPFEAAELRARVARLVLRAREDRARPRREVVLRGDLSQVSLVSLLSFLEAERRTGLVRIRRGDRAARLHVRDGNVVRADLPESVEHLEGIERLLFVLDWDEGAFEVDAARVDGPDSIGLPTRFALLEHARRRDEAGR